MQVQVDVERAEDHAGQAADREDDQEGQRVEHRRVQRDRAAPDRRHPAELLDGRRDGHEEGQEGEREHRVGRLTRREHVVAPHQEADDRDRQRRERDQLVAEQRLAAVDRDQLADDAEGRQHHDVDGRVRVEPEEVLEEHRVTTQARVEDPDVVEPLEGDQQHRDAEHRRRQDLQQRGRVERPHEQRHAEPGHARRAQLVHGHDEVQAREDRAEAEHEDREADRHDRLVGVDRVGRVERPAGVEAAEDDRQRREHGADHPQVERQQVEARQRHVLGPHHQRQHHVPDRARDRRDHEQEHHEGAVQGEDLVVGRVAEQEALGLPEVQANQQGERAA